MIKLETPLMKTKEDMDKILIPLIKDSKKLIILVIDISKKEHLSLIESFEKINKEDYELLVLNTNEYSGANFLGNFDIYTAPSLFVFKNGEPDSNAVGEEQIKQVRNILANI